MKKEFCWKIEGKLFAGKRCRFQLMVVSLQDDVVSKELDIAVYYAARDVQRRVKSDADRAGRVSRFSLCSSPQVKKAAVDIVQGLTGSEDGLQSLCSHSDVLIPSLSRVLSEKKEVSEPAAEALINLSQKPEQAAKMVAMGMIKTAMDILYKQGSGITRLLVMLLVNLTQSDDGIASLLQTGDEKIQGLYLMKLVRSFCTSSTETTDDPFEHVGPILVNISKKDSGRKMLLDPKRGMLKQIVRQFDSTNPLRKKGVCITDSPQQLNFFLEDP
ncbi:hypothetical protein CK203_082906 [Vitis vinifera]|uniref:Protein HGH1 N-terminal domain-containing protein n=1 Tax=Vitis vinifera TaxID=29760 RepID=A0A438D6Z0_VITVI|nr:hypothetical protein CK203_082906 [Vitis vinifera]